MQFPRHHFYFRKHYQKLLAVNIGNVKTPHHVLGHNLQQCHEGKNKIENRRKKFTTNTNYVAPLILLARTDFERFIMNSLFKRECINLNEFLYQKGLQTVELPHEKTNLRAMQSTLCEPLRAVS